jgi:hypothetical protein
MIMAVEDLQKSDVMQHLLDALDRQQDIGHKDYSPPKRDRIPEWQAQQDFPICPNADAPEGCSASDLTDG